MIKDVFYMFIFADIANNFYNLILKDLQRMQDWMVCWTPYQDPIQYMRVH